MSYSYADYEQDLSQKVAFLYLDAGLTQSEVAGFYGLKRWQIVRMLASVRESGAVQIRLSAKPNHCSDLERRLESRYRLDQAFVVPYPQRPEAVTDIISRVLGGYLSDCIVDGMSIGVGCGRTLTSSLQFIPWKPRSGVAVASLLGGFTRKATFDPFEFALRLGDRCSADTRSLAAPLFAPDRRTRDTLSEFVSGDRSFAGVERFDLAVVSVGDLSPSSTFRTYGLLEADEIEALEACGAVGDVLFRFFDRHGELVDHEINDCVIAADPRTLRSARRTVLASGGHQKLDAFRAAMHLLAPHVVITDERIAATLLQT